MGESASKPKTPFQFGNWETPRKRTVLAEGDVEEAGRGAGRSVRTEALVLRVLVDTGEHVIGRCETITGNVTARVHFFLEDQRKQPTQVLVVQVQFRFFSDVRGEDGSVRTHQTVAPVRLVVGHVGTSVVLVDESELSYVGRTGEHGHVVGVGAVLVVHESEFFVGELLLFGDDVLGQFEKGVFVAPEQLTDGDLDERFYLEDVHDARHGQTEKAGGVLRLRSGALERGRLSRGKDTRISKVVRTSMGILGTTTTSSSRPSDCDSSNM